MVSSVAITFSLIPYFGTEFRIAPKGGRKPKMTDSKIESAKKLLASGVPPKDVAKNLGVSIPTLRPLFIGLTLLFLGLAFRKLYLVPQVCTPGTPCADPRTLVRPSTPAHHPGGSSSTSWRALPKWSAS